MFNQNSNLVSGLVGGLLLSLTSVNGMNADGITAFSVVQGNQQCTSGVSGATGTHGSGLYPVDNFCTEPYGIAIDGDYAGQIDCESFNYRSGYQSFSVFCDSGEPEVDLYYDSGSNSYTYFCSGGDGAQLGTCNAVCNGGCSGGVFCGEEAIQYIQCYGSGPCACV